MTRWAALLRGVNVGGVTVRSADLAALFRELGFADVSTILATGNVVFTTDGAATDGAATAATAALPQLKSRIEAGLRDRFGYDAWIVLVPHADLARICTGYAFERDDEVVHPYVIFGSDEAVLDDFFASAIALSTGSTGSTGSAGSTADVARAPGVVYWRVERGSTTDSPVGKLLSRARYAASTTTRNLRTVEKIVAR